MFAYIRKLVKDLFGYQDPVPESAPDQPVVVLPTPSPQQQRNVEKTDTLPKVVTRGEPLVQVAVELPLQDKKAVKGKIKERESHKPPKIQGLIPKSTVKQYHFARMGEKTTLDPDLPSTQKQHNSKTITLAEIPFEQTRSELVQLYVVLIHKLIQQGGLSSLSPPSHLVSHYLFLKTLAAAEENSRDKLLLANLADSVGSYLNKNEKELLKMAKPYADSSEYPIIGWLKTRQLNQNFLVSFIFEQNKRELTHQQKAFINNFRQSPAFLFPNQVYMAWLAQSYDTDSRLQPLSTNGMTTQYYHSNITDNLLLRTKQKEVTLGRDHVYQMGRDPVDTDYRFNIDTATLIGIQGRTLLFQGGNGQVFAMKVQKEGEPKSAFTEEYQMAAYLNKHQKRLGLQSQLPTPLGQYSISRSALSAKFGKVPGFAKFSDMIADKSNLEVYVYKAPASYFSYLHNPDQTLEEFGAAVRKNVNDLFVLLREGIVFPQLADMFHTRLHEEERSDVGLYQALVNILRVMQNEMGRLDKWKEAVKFVNLRSSGMADLGDSTSINSLLTVSAFTRKYYSELLSGGLMHASFVDKNTGEASSLFTSKRRVFGNYLYLNIMAEYLLVLQLTLGSYGDAVTAEMNSRDKAIVWAQLSEMMFRSCAQAVSVMTGMPEDRALLLIQQRANITRHAKQTAFWMTPDYSRLSKSEINEMQYELYSGESGYDVRDELVENVGLAMDGEHQDLGGYNQASPLKELEKILFATVTLIEGTKQLDKQYLDQIDAVELALESNKKAEECYSAVAKLLDMARPGANFQKTLAISYYKSIKEKFPESKSELDARFEKVEKQDAARKLYRFWKEHRVEQTKSKSSDSSLDPLIYTPLL